LSVDSGYRKKLLKPQSESNQRRWLHLREMENVRLMKSPLIVNYGAGVDSTAMLIGMRKRDMVPDLVIFADTGGEKPQTYAYIPTMNGWLRKAGFPSVTQVAFKPARVKYHTLEENCLINETLPSLSFGYKSCSLKFKADPMDKFLLGVSRGPNKQPGWPPALEARAAGLKPVKCIGYDNGPKDSRRSVGKGEDDNFIYRYPLREWGWDRARCMQEIIDEGMPVPLKSACFFCPASKKWELYWMAARHPDLFLRCIAIEDGARNGEHGLGNVLGLNRKWSWKAWATEVGILKRGKIVMSKRELLKRAMAEKPPGESNR
jgi:hypothetical protein